jgi:predicted phage tail protein
MTDRPLDLSRFLDRIEVDRTEDRRAVEAVEEKLVDARSRIKDLERDLSDLRRMTETARTQAAAVAKNLEAKEQQEIADEKARQKVAKWIQIALGAIVLIVTLWSSKWTSALDQLKELLGAAK